MDWYGVYGLDNDQAYYLTELEHLRVENPLLWYLVMNNRSSRRIAMKLGWPHFYVLGKLRELKRETRVYDKEGPKSMEWHLAADETDLLELQDWAMIQRREGGLFNPYEERQE